HDLHVWSITQSLRALSAHILTDDISSTIGATIQREISEMVSRKYAITHATLQLECACCEPDSLYCGMAGTNHNHQNGEGRP
ncbi:MAG: cation transporter, partial [Syntrophales bacterium LBB04]|nr:cation transporter [Syntrophales bacterium LBB04]